MDHHVVSEIDADVRRAVLILRPFKENKVSGLRISPAHFRTHRKKTIAVRPFKTVQSGTV